MIHTLAKRIASVFIRQGIIAQEDDDIYTYACETIVSTLFNCLLSLLISLCFGMFWEGVVFTFAFALFRGFTGGHHAQTHAGCITAFACLLTVSLLLLQWLPQESYRMLSVIISGITLLTVLALAPVAHVNKYLKPTLKRTLKLKSIIVAFTFAVGCTVGTFFCPSRIFTAILLSMLSVCGSMAFAVLTTLYKEKTQNEH